MLLQRLTLDIVLLQRISVFELKLFLEEFNLYEVFLGEHGFQSAHMTEVTL